MCLNPLNIINPTRRVSLYQAQLMQMNVRCNKCAECLKAIQSEWYFRSYYHAKSTLMMGGYVMMDTFTYRPKDVPRIGNFINRKKYGIQNFMCFDYKHVRDFIKLLRIRLARLGYKNKKAFSYFVTSEYGTDENCTHRPHYHILLFVHDVRINPYRLSLLISECWPYGRTDGLKYHPKLYVDQHIYGYKSNDDIQVITMVTNYVSKYVTKDSTYQSTIDKRLAVVKNRVDEKQYKELYRHISMFHRQSQGFGLDYLNIITQAEFNEMLETTEMVMPDTKYVHRRIKLPMYYIRKLYYQQDKEVIYPNLVWREKGEKQVRKYWRLNEFGKEWRKKYLKKSIDNMCEQLHSTYINMLPDEQYIFNRYLNGREYRDYCAYILLFRGRLKNGFSMCSETSMIDHIVDYDTPYIDDNYLYRFRPLGPSFVLKDFVTDKDMSYKIYYADEKFKKCGHCKAYNLYMQTDDRFTRGYEIHQYGYYQSTEEYVEQNVYNQNSYLCWEHFDDLHNFLQGVTKRIKSNVQPAFDYVNELKQRYKAMKGGV